MPRFFAKIKRTEQILVAVGLPLGLVLCACNSAKPDPKAEAPPPAVVEQEMDSNNFKVDHPELFPLTTVAEHKSVPALNVTGVVQPDVARAVPVISLATGRVVQISARLGDTVKKGQVLLRVQSADISGAYSDYQKAVADAQLARTQLERAKLLYEHGAISLNDFQIAQDTDAKAQVDVKTTAERLRVLGSPDLDQPSGIVEIRAPISGVITDQQVTNAAGVQGLPGPNPFTISDLSYVWIICDVYENDLDAVHLGEYADIHLNAYPKKVLKGRIDNILPILDPSIRTAKVRLEVPNPDRVMRVGMFATATFYGKQPEMHTAVPASAVLHLHDRNWVFMALGGGRFRRVEVVAGDMLPNQMQEVISGLKAGDQVVTKALDLESTVVQ